MLIRQGRRADLLARLRHYLEIYDLLGLVPPQALMHLDASATLAERQQIAVRWEIEKINDALAPLGFPLIVLKGAAYVMAALPAASGRLFNDIDILVPPEMLAQTEAALMLAGLFVALAARTYGTRRLADDFVNVTPGAWRAGRLYEWMINYLVPVEVVLMFSWWIYQAVTVYDPEGWWHPLHVYSVGTCLVQWGLALALLIAYNRKLAAVSTRPAGEAVE